MHWVHSTQESPTEWSLRMLLLAFWEVKGNHSSENLARVVMEIIKVAGLTSKVCVAAVVTLKKPLIQLVWVDQLDHFGQCYVQ